MIFAAAATVIPGFADAPPIPHSPTSSPTAMYEPPKPKEPPPQTSGSSSSSGSSETESEKLARYLRQDTEAAKTEADKATATLALTVEAADALEDTAIDLTKLTEDISDIEFPVVNSMVIAEIQKKSEEADIIEEETVALFENAANDIDQAKLETAAIIQSNRRDAADKTNEVQSQQGGDPVHLSSGTYAYTDTDIDIPLFPVTRMYTSTGKTRGSWGRYWTSPFDERILRGYSSVNHERLEQTRKAVAKAAAQRTELEAKIQYVLHNFDRLIENDIEETQQSIDETVREIEQTAEEINAKTGPYTEALASAQKLADQCSEFARKANEAASRTQPRHPPAQEHADRAEAFAVLAHKVIKPYTELSMKIDSVLAVSAEKAAYMEAETVTTVMNLRREAEMQKEAFISRMKNTIDSINESEAAQKEALEKLEAEQKRADALKSKNVLLERFTDLSYASGGGNETLTHVDGTGRTVHYTYEGDGIWKPSDGYAWPVIESADGSDALNCSGFIVRERNGDSHIFDAHGLLAEIRTASGKSTSIARDGTGSPQSVTASGRVWTVRCLSGTIDSIQTPAAAGSTQRVHQYAYTDGVLTSYTNPDANTVSYKYVDGLLAAIVKPDASQVVIEYGLALSNGISLVTSTIDEEGYAERFEYPEPGTHTIHYTQSGMRTDFYFNSQKRTIREERADGTVISTVWSDAGNSPSQRFFSTAFASFTERYDDYGDIVYRSHPDGSAETWERNDRGDIKRRVDRDGIETEYAYDERGNMTSESRQGTVLKEIQWNETGNPILIRERGLGNVELTWDKNGLPASRAVLPVSGEKDTQASRESWTWDGEGRIASSTDAEGRTTTYEYGVRTVSTVYPSGLRVTRETDARGDCVRISEKDQKTGAERVTEIEYDKRHLPVRTQYPDGRTETVTYRADGKPSERTMNRKSIRYSYRVDGSPEKTELRIGEKLYSETTYENCPQGKRIRTYVEGQLTGETILDFDGNEISRTDGEGNTVYTTRSGAGGIRMIQNEFGGVSEQIYSDDGYVTEIREDGATVAEFERDEAGRIQSVRSADGSESFYVRNRFGVPITERTKAGVREYSYDRAGQLTGEKAYTATRAAQAGSMYIKRLEYSADGRTVTVREGERGQHTVFELDAWGAVVAVTDGEGNTTRRDYDSGGRLASETYSDGTRTAYTYGEDGELSRISYADGSYEQYSRDTAGNITAIDGSGGKIYTARYDLRGNLTAERRYPEPEYEYTLDKAGRTTEVRIAGKTAQRIRRSVDGRTIAVADAKGNERILELDRFGRIVGETDRLGNRRTIERAAGGIATEERTFSGKTIRYEFDPEENAHRTRYADGTENIVYRDLNGRILKAENEAGSILWSLDAAGNIVEQSDLAAREASVYSYDKAGRLTGMTSGERRLSYRYDARGRTASIADSGTGLETAFAYDPLGRVVRQENGNGSSTTVRYDAAGRVQTVQDADAAGTVIGGFGWLYSDEGRRTHRLASDGSVSVYEYTERGHVSRIYNPDTAATRGRLDGAEERYSFNAHEQQRIAELAMLLNPAQRRSNSAAQNMIAEKYDYDANGNRTVWSAGNVSIDYEYNAEDRIVRAGDSEYRHDADGNLIAEKNLRIQAEYGYTDGNRMKYAEIRDTAENTHTVTEYAYDALGRRTARSGSNGESTRTVYDRYGFDIIRISAVYGDGTPVGASSGRSPSAPATGATAGRYAYIKDASQNRYDPIGETAQNSQTFRGIQRPLSMNGHIYAVSLEALGTGQNGNYYLGSGTDRTVNTVTDQHGSVAQTRTYSAFGMPEFQTDNSIPWSWIGKPYDTDTGLIDFGYRDYDPALARFTTSDPARDGTNWYTYAVNDPVNFLDLWGLDTVVEMTYTKDSQTLVVQTWDDNKPNRPTITRHYRATNNPQPMTTPKATTIPSGENYYPQSYPNGTWNVTSVTHPDNNAYGHTKINTTAGQKVPTYTKVNGEWEQTGTTWDTGYQIHGGGYSTSPQGENNVNDNTYGCLRMENSAVNELGTYVDKHLKNGDTVTLTVQDKLPDEGKKNK